MEGGFQSKIQMKECTNNFKGEAELSVESHNILFEGIFLCRCIQVSNQMKVFLIVDVMTK